MPVDIHTGDATAALTHGRQALEDAKSGLSDAADNSGDPRVKAALEGLRRKTSDDIDTSSGHSRTGKHAVDMFADTDRRGAAAVTATSMPSGGLGGGNGAGAAAPQFNPAQMMGSGSVGQPSAVQSMMSAMAAPLSMVGQAAPAVTQVAAPMASPPVSAGAGGGYPAGTVMVSQSRLAQLVSVIDSRRAGGRVGGAGSGTPTSWDGSTKPDPIDVGQVALEKTHGKLSEAEQHQALQSAMDKTGITTNPAVRAKFESVLRFMGDHESGDDASAVNTTDSNATGVTASDGAPSGSSRGWLQCIPSTFAANHAPGTSNNIYDPEASAGAAINHMKSTYHVGNDGSGLEAFAAGRQAGGYTGY